MVTVRDAGVQDARAVAAVHVRAWQAAYRGLLPDGYLDGLNAPDRAARYTFGLVGPEHPATQVVSVAGQICGFVTTGPARGGLDAACGEVYALYVDPGSWRRGLGRVLIGRARARLAGRGFARAVLWVLAGNEAAECFYRADGWHADGRQQVQGLWGVPVAEVGYARELP